MTRRGLSAYLAWAAAAYGLAWNGRALVASALSFDLSTTGLLAPLLVGGTVRLARDPGDLVATARILERVAGLGFLKVTPTHLGLLADQLESPIASRFATLVIGGEALFGKDLTDWRSWLPGTRMFNEYGPSEVTVACTAGEVPPAAAQREYGPIPIGRPIPGAQLRVLDEDLRAVPVGSSGELYVGGAGLARGYLRRPAATALAFIPDPFTRRGKRLYRTGDQVRWLADGRLLFLGRRDRQLKIRGLRIEPGEIEAHLARAPKVRAAVVVPLTTSMDGSRGVRLVAHVETSDTGEADPAALELKLCAFLSRRLPASMVPTVWMFHADLPRSARGKIDPNRLPPPRLRVQSTYRPPRNARESAIAELWADVLELEKVGVTDNFFELGGDSLSAIRLIAAARRRGWSLTLRDLFENQTVAALAGALHSREGSG